MKKKIMTMTLAVLLGVTQIPLVNAKAFFTSDNSTSEIISEETNEGVQLNTYMEQDLEVPLPQQDDDDGIRRASLLPAKYDSRALGLVTPVKNQGSFGDCWTFAAMAAAETSILKNGLSTGSAMPDLAELQLSYFLYNRTNDPLGNTAGDRNYVKRATGVNGYLNNGGNNLYTAIHLSQWSGVTDETGPLVRQPVLGANPNPQGSTALDSSLNYLSTYKLQDAIFLGSRTTPTDKDIQDIKQAIIDYGSVTVSYASSGLSDKAYIYYDDNRTTDHAVTIVGYDDSISRTNFKTESGEQPFIDGAWIMKNSWGTGKGDSGYYYISYETPLNNIVAYNYMAGDTYEKNYFYDGAVNYKAWDYGQRVNQYANIYTADKAREGTIESLEAVSIGVYSANTDYSIQIYTNLQNGQNPTSGTPMLKNPQTGSLTYSGIYTISLDQAVDLQPGEKFSVVVTLSSKVGNTSMLCSATGESGWMGFIESTASGQSFIASGNSAWKDLHSVGRVARIKALTRTRGEVSLEADIKVKSSILNNLSNNIIFNSFFASRQSVTINPASEETSVYYYLSHWPMSKSAVEAIADDRWAKYSGPFVIQANNKYVIYAKVVDRWGNTNYISSTGIVVDNTKPTITVNDGVDFGSDWYNTEQSIKLTVGDATSGIKSVTISGADQDLFTARGDQITTSWNNGNNPIKVKDGNNSYLITATDNSGNTLRYNLSVKQDTTAPTIIVNDGVDFSSGWYTTEQSIKLSVADYTSGIRSISYRIDGGAEQSLFTSSGGRVSDWDNWANPIKVQNGTHTYEIIATDNAGNRTVTAVKINQQSK